MARPAQGSKVGRVQRAFRGNRPWNDVMDLLGDVHVALLADRMLHQERTPEPMPLPAEMRACITQATSTWVAHHGTECWSLGLE